MARILVIDNYDSFVYNLVQYLAQLGAEVDVWRNDVPRFADADWAEAYDGVLISPGVDRQRRVGRDQGRGEAGRDDARREHEDGNQQSSRAAHERRSGDAGCSV